MTIRDVLDSYEQLEKQNEEYIKDIKILKKIIVELNYALADYVPKRVIKEKLEKLAKSELFQEYHFEEIKIAVDILKQLLGGE